MAKFEFGLISKTLWHSKRYRAMKDPVAKLLYCYLHTNQHRNSIGCYGLLPGYACHDLDIDLETYDRAMDRAIDSGLIQYDRELEIVLIIDFFRFNPITNSKHAIGARKCIARLPECSIKQKMVEIYNAHAGEKDLETIGCGDDDTPSHTPMDTPSDTPVDTGMHTTGTREYGIDITDTVENISTVCTASDDAAHTKPWISKKGKELKGSNLKCFKEFWTAFGYSRGRAEAIDAYLAINDRLPLHDQIIAGAKYEASERHVKVNKGLTAIHASSWLKGRRWEELEEASNVVSMFDHSNPEHWRGKIGEPDSKFSKSFWRENWRPDLGPNPWEQFNPRIPHEIHSEYGVLWGWKKQENQQQKAQQ